MKNRILQTTLFIAFSFLSIAQESDVFSADQYFNKGNTAYNSKQYGEAVYQFEKALILDPGAHDIHVNLKLAVERLDSDIIELEPFFLADWWKSISDMFLPGTWKMLSVAFLIALLVMVFVYLFKGKLTAKVTYSLGSVFIVLIFISTLAGFTRANSIFDNKYAVLSGSIESLLEGPDLVSEKVKPVVSGVKIKILDSNAEWYKVAAMDSEHGWVLKSQVRLLKFPQ